MTGLPDTKTISALLRAGTPGALDRAGAMLARIDEETLARLPRPLRQNYAALSSELHMLRQLHGGSAP